MTRLFQLAKTLIAPTALKGTLAIAALGAVPTAAFAGHDHHYRLGFGPFHLRVTVGDGQAEPEVPAGYREVRHWVPPVYQIVTDRQWIEPVYRTVVDHVWVPAHDDVRYDEHRHRERRERVMVPGHYEDVSRQEIVNPGHYEDVQRQELLTPAHWETQLEAIPVVPR